MQLCVNLFLVWMPYLLVF